MIQEHLPSENLPVDFALVSVTDDDSGRNGYESSTDKLINENNDDNELTDFQSNDLIIYKISALVSFDREQNATVYPMIRCIDQGSDR
uniref:Uncharacterized protein n=1 Tax=Trichobilharzia regenti TaxID=157069 RepID=A0AA85KKK3_TRIRE|nr:unnamed protein product [Trichobilharzia regenti]